MEAYKNDYKKHEDEALWEIHRFGINFIKNLKASQ